MGAELRLLSDLGFLECFGLADVLVLRAVAALVPRFDGRFADPAEFRLVWELPSCEVGVLPAVAGCVPRLDGIVALFA